MSRKNSVLKILTIIGARPQFIKAASLSRMLQNYANVNETLVHTGQHFDPNMSDIFFSELGIPTPKYHLDIHGGSHGQMTGRMLEGIDNVLRQEQSDALLVYGDTNSTLAGALAASKLHVPVIHVEAGLRSYNRCMPEEINRVLTDHLSKLLFCPTKTAVMNLAKEGITEGVYHSGDIMCDATLYAATKLKDNVELKKNFDFLMEDFAIMTIHRVESTNSLEIFKKIVDYANQFSIKNNLKIIFSVHPRTKKLLNGLLYQLSENILLIDPLSYFEMHFLLSKAKFVLTDSGGLQKEAYFHRVPCVTLRSETEWVETLESGWNRLWTVDTYQKRQEINDYGDGNSSRKIIDNILSHI